MSSFRRIYFEGFIASFVNQAKTVMASIHIINLLNLPSNAFNTIAAIRTPSGMAINSFLEIDHMSACRSTTQFLATMNMCSFRLPHMRQLRNLVRRHHKTHARSHLRPWIIRYGTWVFPVYTDLVIDSQKYFQFPIITGGRTSSHPKSKKDTRQV